MKTQIAKLQVLSGVALIAVAALATPAAASRAPKRKVSVTTRATTRRSSITAFVPLPATTVPSTLPVSAPPAVAADHTSSGSVAISAVSVAVEASTDTTIAPVHVAATNVEITPVTVQVTEVSTPTTVPTAPPTVPVGVEAAVMERESTEADGVVITDLDVPVLSANAAGSSVVRVVASPYAANVRSCATTSCGVVGVVRTNTPVTMTCWTDTQWVLGNYSSNRWFRIIGGGVTGFIHSSFVYNQTLTPNCAAPTPTPPAATTSSKAELAARWAEARIGQIVPARGENPNDATRWSGWCETFAEASYRLGASLTIFYTSADNHLNAVRAKLQTGVPPRGAIVLYTPNHVAVSVGGGNIVSTIGGVYDKSPSPIQKVPYDGWFKDVKYVGWYLP